MNELVLMDLGRNALITTVMLAAPMLVVALVVGVVVGIVQAMTQIQEPTISFVPKILGIFAVLVVTGPWIGGTAVSYTVALFSSLPRMVR